METPFGLIHVWSQGDLVTRSVFAVLVFMSLVSWVVILVKALGVVRAKRQAARVEGFWHSSDMAEGLSKLALMPTTRFGSSPSTGARPPPTNAPRRRSCTTR